MNSRSFELSRRHALLIQEAPAPSPVDVSFGLGEVGVTHDLSRINPFAGVRDRESAQRIAHILVEHGGARELLTWSLWHAAMDERCSPDQIAGYLEAHGSLGFNVTSIAVSASRRALAPFQAHPCDLSPFTLSGSLRFDVGPTLALRKHAQILMAVLMLGSEKAKEPKTFELGKVSWLAQGMDELVASLLVPTIFVRASHPLDLEGTHWWDVCSVRVLRGKSVAWAKLMGAAAAIERETELLMVEGEETQALEYVENFDWSPPQMVQMAQVARRSSWC